MAEFDPKWLKSLLHKQSVEQSVVSILETNCQPAVSKGYNYASDIKRVSMKVVMGNGDLAKKSLIVKSMPSTELHSKQIREWGIFKKEIKMYNEVLHCMDELFKEIEEVVEPLWPACIYTKPYTTIVFEDLKVSGFKMASRFEGLGLKEAKLALRGLAKFHAASIVLKDRDVLDPADFKFLLVEEKPIEMMRLFQEKYLEEVSQTIEENWTPEWNYYAVALRKLKNNSINLWKQSFAYEENSKFNVLNHGDFWIINLMFKYIADTDIPCAFRMLDFQICHYNSLVIDLLRFTNTSLKVEVRKDHTDELTVYYHTNLIKYMKLFNLEESRMPTIDELRQEIDKRLLIGLIDACTVMPLIKTDPNDTDDVEEVYKKLDKNTDIDINNRIFLDKTFIELLRITLLECKAKGIL